MAKVNKTITVDPVKMSLFENTKNIHGLNISDFVDQKLEEFLNSSSPDEMQKIRIQNLKAELIEAERSLPEIEFMMKMKGQQQNHIKKDEDESAKLEAHREKEFKKYSSTLYYQRKNRIQHDWSKIQEDFRFKTKFEAQDYINSMMNANIV